jgi:epoxyqueuosine reductase
MNSSTPVKALKVKSLLEKYHFKTAILSVSQLGELEKHIQHFYKQGAFDESFYQERLTHFTFDASLVLPGARSIIITTIRQPIVHVTFLNQGRSYPILVPPTYNNSTDHIAAGLLKGLFKAGGFHVLKVDLPEKLLLVFSGIAKYGKNNIAYVDGMGSFHRPVAFLTDAGLEEDKWVPLETHDRCKTCKACIQSCPSGAISRDRFLLNAEKCITYHNERNHSFPHWIKSKWHNCLIGCMICQSQCPLNKDYKHDIVNAFTFSEPETLEILRNTPKEGLSQSTSNKLSEIGLLDDCLLLGRNLKVLLNQANELV